jgi:hypothetical protein
MTNVIVYPMLFYLLFCYGTFFTTLVPFVASVLTREPIVLGNEILRENGYAALSGLRIGEALSTERESFINMDIQPGILFLFLFLQLF